MSVPTSAKLAALSTLCLQNSALILSMRWSRSVLHDSYLDSTIILTMELTKLLVSSMLMMRDGGRLADLGSLVWQSLPIALPSGLYVVQNSLQLLAVQNLDASVFSVLSQAKVFTTALFSWWILKRRLNHVKWASLLLLVTGCILVQQKPVDCTIMTEQMQAQANLAAASTVVGLTCTAGMVFLSGLAGVLIERQLKNQGSAKQLSLWERNIQLSVWGVIFASAAMLSRDSGKLVSGGFFQGWSPFAVIVVMLQSVGGLVTAVVVKYTDTIIKGFAVGLSVVMTALASWLLFETQLTLTFACGATIVLASIFFFNLDVAPAATMPSAEAKKQGLSPGTPYIVPSSVGVDPAERSGLLTDSDRERLSDIELGTNKTRSPAP